MPIRGPPNREAAQVAGDDQQAGPEHRQRNEAGLVGRFAVIPVMKGASWR